MFLYIINMKLNLNQVLLQSHSDTPISLCPFSLCQIYEDQRTTAQMFYVYYAINQAEIYHKSPGGNL